MAGLFPVRVERLEPARGAPGRVRIILSDGGGETLTEARCVAIGVRAGSAWTPDLAAACARGAAIERAREAALRLLKRGPRSRARLRDRLLEAGHADTDADAALDELARAGLVDDAAFARALADAAADRGPGRRYLIEQKLADAGVSHDIVADAVASACPDPATDARSLVEARLARTPGHEPRLKTAARLARLLASRGFDEQVAREAIEAVMGTIEDEHHA